MAELPELQARQALALRGVTPGSGTVPRFGLFELTLDLRATYDNPFDPDDIEVRCAFTAPDGHAVTVDGFFYQPYALREGSDETRTPLLDAAGEPCWKVRYTPLVTGRHTYRLTARDRPGTVESAPGDFTVVGSDRPGFVRVSGRHPRYFAFDNGASFFPVGQNLQNDWPVYRHSRLLAEAGGNALRVWMFCHWTWLDWSVQPEVAWAGPGHFLRSYGGAGVYNQRIAWIADHHLAAWERDGLYLMLCLGNGNELGQPERHDSWGGHPYNAVNAGGFLSNGNEFWTDSRARALYRQRLRYIAARYGHSPAIWAWELWNELGRENDAIVAWHGEMAAYLAEIDPNRHLVSTSHWGNNPEINTRTWAIPGIHFTQIHNYAGAATILRRTARMLALSPKPHIIGEGGGPSPGRDGREDPDGIDFHNCLWAAAACGAAGTTLPWWWRERIEPRGLFGHYTAFSRFAETMPWAEEGLAPIPPAEVRVQMPPGPKTYQPVVLKPQGPGWGSRAPRDHFRVLPDGTVPDIEAFSPVLFGSARESWRTTPVLEVECPAPGQFLVHVTEAAHGILEIDVDGRTVLRDETLDTERQGVNRDVAVPLAAGSHRVVLRNAGSDWVRFDRIVLTAYRDASVYPVLDACGLRSPRTVFLWVHHRLNDWAHRAVGAVPEPVSDARVAVPVASGRWRIERWDPYAGEVSMHGDIEAVAGPVEVPLPPVARDVAVVLRRQAP
ncbi:MAG: DUF5060 domain-containing protein [Lentisphaeria bacterium]|nr:DUF5060 domain-containing protein [Lentisphaeria bacterium]